MCDSFGNRLQSSPVPVLKEKGSRKYSRRRGGRSRNHCPFECGRKSMHLGVQTLAPVGLAGGFRVFICSFVCVNYLRIVTSKT